MTYHFLNACYFFKKTGNFDVWYRVEIGNFFLIFGFFLLVFSLQVVKKTEVSSSFLTQFAIEILQFLPCVERVLVRQSGSSGRIAVSQDQNGALFLKNRITTEPLPTPQKSQKTEQKTPKTDY